MMKQRWQRRMNGRLENWANKESGQASMVTVAMFMMLFAVVAVSFTYIVVTASRQAVNDSLNSSAKAAAESGVEDAKRLLVYCYNARTGDDTYNSQAATDICRKVIGKRIDDAANNCTDILGAVNNQPDVKKNFAIEDDGQGGFRVRVGGGDADANGENNEYYQCLKIATRTNSYEDALNADSDSNIVPLRLVDKNGNAAVAAQIIVSWHNKDNGELGDGPVSLKDTTGTGLPSSTQWNSINRPAVLRVEQVGVPKGSFSINDLVANDAAVTLRPSTGGTNELGKNSNWASQYHPTYNDRPNAQYNNIVSKSPIAETKCNQDNNATAASRHSCTMTLYGTVDTRSMDYYLRLNAIYSDTHFQIKAKDAAGNDLYFDGVQPVVDVTGKSADSFSRIQAHLSPNHADDDSAWWPEYAIDTDGKVCKDMNVYYDNGTDNCD